MRRTREGDYIIGEKTAMSIGLVITIIVLLSTAITSVAIVKGQVADNQQDISNNILKNAEQDVSINNLNTRMTVMESQYKDIKESLDRIEKKLNDGDYK